MPQFILQSPEVLIVDGKDAGPLIAYAVTHPENAPDIHAATVAWHAGVINTAKNSLLAIQADLANAQQAVKGAQKETLDVRAELDTAKAALEESKAARERDRQHAILDKQIADLQAKKAAVG